MIRITNICHRDKSIIVHHYVYITCLEGSSFREWSPVWLDPDSGSTASLHLLLTPKSVTVHKCISIIEMFKNTFLCICSLTIKNLLILKEKKTFSVPLYEYLPKFISKTRSTRFPLLVVHVQISGKTKHLMHFNKS